MARVTTASHHVVASVIEENAVVARGAEAATGGGLDATINADVAPGASILY